MSDEVKNNHMMFSVYDDINKKHLFLYPSNSTAVNKIVDDLVPYYYYDKTEARKRLFLGDDFFGFKVKRVNILEGEING